MRCDACYYAAVVERLLASRFLRQDGKSFAANQAIELIARNVERVGRPGDVSFVNRQGAFDFLD